MKGIDQTMLALIIFIIAIIVAIAAFLLPMIQRIGEQNPQGCALTLDRLIKTIIPSITGSGTQTLGSSRC